MPKPEINNPNDPSPVLSRHASIRASQRKFSQTEIEYVLQNGRVMRRTGICFYFLAVRDVPIADRHLAWVQHLVGTTILLDASQEHIITLYKNKTALREIKRKSKNRSI